MPSLYSMGAPRGYSVNVGGVTIGLGLTGKVYRRDTASGQCVELNTDGAGGAIHRIILSRCDHSGQLVLTGLTPRGIYVISLWPPSDHQPTLPFE